MTVSEGPPEVPTPRKFAEGRPTVQGKFLFLGAEKFWVRGISYGTFYMDENRQEPRAPETVERDFSQMAARGFNVVRVYTAPPRWLLDAAWKHGLRVMIGLNWGEHMAFLDEPGRIEEIEGRIRTWIRSCAGHPAVFCYIIGNEIPASIVPSCSRRLGSTALAGEKSDRPQCSSRRSRGLSAAAASVSSSSHGRMNGTTGSTGSRIGRSA